MNITFVKKILKDGSPCRKCAEVEQRLMKSGYIDQITNTVTADERDGQSLGMQLAAKHGVKLAPFFIVEDGSETRVYTVYFKFIKAEFQSKAKKTLSDMEDTLRSNPDLERL